MNVNNSDIFNIHDIQHVKLNMRWQQNTWASKIIKEEHFIIMMAMSAKKGDNH